MKINIIIRQQQKINYITDFLDYIMLALVFQAFSF